MPTSISGPVNLYTQQIYLQEDGNVTLGLLGARNAVFLVGFYRRSEAITGAGGTLPPELVGLNDNTQKGVTLNWTHNLNRTLILSMTGTLSQTVAIAPLARQDESGVRFAAGDNPAFAEHDGVRRRPLSEVQFQRGTGYNEAAVFAGFNYIFK